MAPLSQQDHIGLRTTLEDRGALQVDESTQPADRYTPGTGLFDVRDHRPETATSRDGGQPRAQPGSRGRSSDPPGQPAHSIAARAHIKLAHTITIEVIYNVVEME